MDRSGLPAPLPKRESNVDAPSDPACKKRKLGTRMGDGNSDEDILEVANEAGSKTYLIQLTYKEIKGDLPPGQQLTPMFTDTSMQNTVHVAVAEEVGDGVPKDIRKLARKVLPRFFQDNPALDAKSLDDPAICQLELFRRLDLVKTALDMVDAQLLFRDAGVLVDCISIVTWQPASVKPEALVTALELAVKEHRRSTTALESKITDLTYASDEKYADALKALIVEEAAAFPKGHRGQWYRSNKLKDKYHCMSKDQIVEAATKHKQEMIEATYKPMALAYSFLLKTKDLAFRQGFEITTGE